jgi:hypothetical protein
MLGGQALRPTQNSNPYLSSVPTHAFPSLLCAAAGATPIQRNGERMRRSSPEYKACGSAAHLSPTTLKRELLRRAASFPQTLHASIFLSTTPTIFFKTTPITPHPRSDVFSLSPPPCSAASRCVSAAGTHLGHNLPDGSGNRYCINLVSVAGKPTNGKPVPRYIGADQ